MATRAPKRCDWCGTDSLYVDYHDKEWGVPVYDDHILFEFLILESMQAGLSWITILRKRENFRAAFDNFDPSKVATYKERKVSSLLKNAGIIRNELKIRAAINNANILLELQTEHGSFADYIWQFVEGTPINNAWKTQAHLPASTPLSDHMAKTLKKRGFRFIGSTICYSFMQAVGMVNDHLISCHRYRTCQS